MLPGRPWQEKVEDVREELRKNQSAILLVTALDEVACESLSAGASGCGLLYCCRAIQLAGFGY